MNTIEEAEELRGQVLSMSAKDRPEIDDDDEFYVQELIGMQVRPITRSHLTTTAWRVIK